MKAFTQLVFSIMCDCSAAVNSLSALSVCGQAEQKEHISYDSFMRVSIKLLRLELRQNLLESLSASQVHLSTDTHSATHKSSHTCPSTPLCVVEQVFRAVIIERATVFPPQSTRNNPQGGLSICWLLIGCVALAAAEGMSHKLV